MSQLGKHLVSFDVYRRTKGETYIVMLKMWMAGAKAAGSGARDGERVIVPPTPEMLRETDGSKEKLDGRNAEMRKR